MVDLVLTQTYESLLKQCNTLGPDTPDEQCFGLYNKLQELRFNIYRYLSDVNETIADNDRFQWADRIAKIRLILSQIERLRCNRARGQWDPFEIDAGPSFEIYLRD